MPLDKLTDKITRIFPPYGDSFDLDTHTDKILHGHEDIREYYSKQEVQEQLARSASALEKLVNQGYKATRVGRAATIGSYAAAGLSGGLLGETNPIGNLIEEYIVEGPTKWGFYKALMKDENLSGLSKLISGVGLLASDYILAPIPFLGDIPDLLGVYKMNVDHHVRKHAVRALRQGIGRQKNAYDSRARVPRDLRIGPGLKVKYA